MEQLKRFSLPIVVGAGALVVLLIVWVAWISPEGSKLSAADAQKSQAAAQVQQLQAEIATLKNEKKQLPKNCQELQKDLAEIPGTPDTSQVYQAITNLAVASGDVVTNSVSVVTPTGNSTPTSGIVPIQVSVGLSGNYGQIMNFLKGLTNPQSMPRLFTVTTATIGGGPVAVGGAPVPAGNGGYTLQLSGDVYYSPGQVDVCSSTSTTTG